MCKIFKISWWPYSIFEKKYAYASLLLRNIYETHVCATRISLRSNLWITYVTVGL